MPATSPSDDALYMLRLDGRDRAVELVHRLRRGWDSAAAGGDEEAVLELHLYAPRPDRPALLYVSAAVVYWAEQSGIPYEFAGEIGRDELPLGAQLAYLSNKVLPP